MPDDAATMSGAKLAVRGDRLIINMPLDDAFALAVALSPCPCKSTKSSAGQEVRARLKQALMYALHV